MKDPAFQQRLLATFRLEAQEHLDSLAAGLIQLEQTPDPHQQSPLIETIFRRAHSLKGAARSVGATEIAALCQSLEAVLARLKAQQLRSSPELLDSLHKSLNTLRHLLSANAAAPQEVQQAAEITRELAAWLQSPAAASSPEAPASPPAADVPAHPPSSILYPPPSSPEAPASETPSHPPSSILHPPSSSQELTLPQTVRIATSKLDAVLFQAEEMLSARLTAAQRVADFETLQLGLERWRKEWAKLQPRLRSLQRAAVSCSREGPVSDQPLPPGDWLQKCAEFLAWNADFVQSLESELARTTQEAARDQRALSAMVDNLLDTTKEALMLPFTSLFELLPKLVRDLSREQHKEVELHLQGGAIEMDRRILEELKDAFIHLVRNSIDHGIELPDERQRRGKPPRGTIRIDIAQKSGSLLEMTIADDGAGLDVAAIRAAAAQAALRSPAELDSLSEEEILSLVFESGLSTAPALTDISGRGLGLAIVREKVEKLGGTISLESRPRAGTTFRLLLPNTLARFRGVLVSAAGRLFVLPSAPIHRVARLTRAEVQSVQNRPTIQLEGRALPLVRLADTLALTTPLPASAAPPAKLSLLVLGSRDKPIAFWVDEILAEQEVLMKSLGKQLARVRHVAGATVLGDGKVVPILNLNDLLKSALKTAGPTAPARPAESAPPTKAVLVAEDSITSRTLLKNILQGAGFKVETAVDGQAAFSLLQARHFDLLVSDVDMPRLSGFDLVAKVRKDPTLAHLPVVLVTALASRADQERGIEAGANAYVVKSSFDQSNLIDVVRRLLR